jgi:hypothetical protein
MQILGYGEDALTWWALTNRLDSILSPFHDGVADTLTVFYRPSFGRRSAPSPSEAGHRGSQFGEFDGIIATRSGVYLLEAKWSGSGELDDAAVILRPEQIRRHRLFRKYLELWRGQQDQSWPSFASRWPTITIDGPAGRPETFRTAPVRSRLASNLRAVLTRCAEAGPAIQDVLLIVHPSAGAVVESRKSPEGFHVVELESPAVADGYVVLSAA